ncbi:metal-dependent hydrolase [Halarchaeum sp. P4]|uniref:metal-dependent hydrolase n=1 Tax=Halarchaeum sp. P4 TaxID=3421639 RepID=UPI003EBB52D8
MNKKDHILNGLLLGAGLGFVLHPEGSMQTLVTTAAVLVPVVLGAMFPDIDTEFGKHRKTLHNLFVVGILYGYTLYFDNLMFVWIGVVTHFVLDVLGSKRGIALFYPLWDKEFGTPVGVTTSSQYATAITVIITIVELVVIYALIHFLPGVVPNVDFASKVQGLQALTG